MSETVQAWKEGKRMRPITAGHSIGEGAWRDCLENLNGVVPDYFTVFDPWWKFDEHARQEITGQYKFSSATAELYTEQVLLPYGYGVVPFRAQHRLEMRATKLEDARKLYLLIRAGKIQPVVFYENGQIPKLRYRVRDLLRETWYTLVLRLKSTLTR